MSEEQTPTPTPTPTPQTPAPQTPTDTKPKASTAAKVGAGAGISALIITVLTFLAPYVSQLLQNQGMSKDLSDKITQQVIDDLKSLQESQNAQSAAALEEAKKLAEENDAKRKQEIEALKKQVADAPLTPAKVDLKPEDIKPWLDILGPFIQKWLDEKMKPKPPVNPLPGPVDPPVNPPVPVNPPIVQPVNPPVPVNPPAPPQPTPTGMRFVLTDSSKDPITSSSVPVGRMIRVMVQGSASQLGWDYSVHGSVEVYDLPLNLGYDFVLKDTSSYINIVAFDANLNKITTRITANQAPQPPPNTDPNSDLVPVTPVTPDNSQAKLSAVNVYIAYDPKTVTPEFTNIINATDYWLKLQATGNKWAFYTLGTQNANGLKVIDYAKSKGVSPPYIVIENPTTSSMIAASTVPGTLDAVNSYVKRYSK